MKNTDKEQKKFIVEVETNSDTSMSMQASKTMINGAFTGYEIAITLIDQSGDETEEMTTFLTSGQAKEFVTTLNDLILKVERLNNEQ